MNKEETIDWPATILSMAPGLLMMVAAVIVTWIGVDSIKYFETQQLKLLYLFFLIPYLIKMLQYAFSISIDIKWKLKPEYRFIENL